MKHSISLQFWILYNFSQAVPIFISIFVDVFVSLQPCDIIQSVIYLLWCFSFYFDKFVVDT